MNKKGFTLIELLAVIIIIAVIASITVVSVNKTLKNSKNSLSDVQIDNIIKASKSYYLEEGMDHNVSCVNVSDLISKNYIETKKVMDPRTKKPMEGSVSISSNGGKVLYGYSDDKCIQIYRLATKEDKTLAGNIPQGNYAPGDEYIINVDGEHEYHFYVLSTEGDKVNLIMSRNICSDGTLATASNNCLVPWISQNDYENVPGLGDYGNTGQANKGPVTIMNYLYETTKNWKNIENIQMNYIDEGGEYGYGGITTIGSTTKIIMKDGTGTGTYENLKARLPRDSEIRNVGCSGTGSCPAWVVNGLMAGVDYYPEGTKEDIEDIKGYWGLASVIGTNASVVFPFGSLSGTYVGDINRGLRPVIEISKTLLNS